MEDIKDLQTKIEISVNQPDIKRPKPPAQASQIKDASTETRIAQTDSKIDPDSLAGSVKEVLNSSQTTVKFGVDTSGDTNGIMFKIVNEETGEIIKEFPEDNLVKVKQLADSKQNVGLLLDAVV